MEENKLINCKLDRNFFLMVLLVGILCNQMVISANDFRMPVRTENKINTSTHFSYENKKEINFYGLSDVIRIGFKKRWVVFSIGDMLLFLGGIGLVYTQIISLSIAIKLKKIRNKKKKKGEV